MSELSPEITQGARKVHSKILRRLAERGQVNIGETLGRSETWVSRWKTDESEDAARVIDSLGFRLIDKDAPCYPPEHIEHLHYFARKGLEAQAPELDWEDE